MARVYAFWRWLLNSSIGDRIAHIRGGMSQAAFANMIGVHKNSLGNYERGERTPDASFLLKLMAAGFNPNWVLSGEGAMRLEGIADQVAEGDTQYSAAAEPAGSREFSYVNRVLVGASAGYGSVVDEERPGPRMAFQTAWLRHEGLDPAHLAVIEARGDSMEPTIHSGDALLVDVSRKEIRGDGIYVIRIDDQLLVKRLQADMRGGVIVKADNRAYGDLVVPEPEILLAGKVVWIGHKL